MVGGGTPCRILFWRSSKLLAKNSSLTSLDVSANYILADGTTALCAALAGNKRLKTLKLNDSAMQEAGWIALARMVEDAPSLVVLEANCNLELMRPAEIPAVAKAIASAVGRSKSPSLASTSPRRSGRMARPAACFRRCWTASRWPRSTSPAPSAGPTLARAWRNA